MLCAIPIEIAARELDGVLYLALHLAARGLPTLLGERMVNRIVLGSGKPVIFFDSDQDAACNQAVLDAGGVVLNLNAEGLNLLDAPRVLENFLRIAPHVSRICAWGKMQAALMRESLPAESAGLVTVTGHPSFDLASRNFLPYYRKTAITQTHGSDYILINTNFTCNHMMGFEKYLEMLGRMPEWKIYRDPKFLAFKRRVAAYQRGLMEPFVELARFLARRFPERHVIIRPHPVENLDFYRKRVKDLPNVFVIRSGSVRSWIASARAVIHHDCTTALEALLMGKPVIRYCPLFDPELAAPLVRDLGVQVRTEEEAAELVLGASPSIDIQDQRTVLEPCLANLTSNAAGTIAGLAAGYAAAGPGAWLPEPLGVWESLKCWRKHLSKVLRSWQPGRNGRKVRYALDKFPYLPLSEVRERLSRLRALESGLPRVRAEQLALNTFLVALVPESEKV